MGRSADWRARYNRHVIRVRTPVVLAAGVATVAVAVIRGMVGA